LTELAGTDKHRPINEHFRTSFTGDNEWYTPVQYIEAAREVMGEIDIDPATSEYGQSRINADIYHTKDNDGLEAPWLRRHYWNHLRKRRRKNKRQVDPEYMEGNRNFRNFVLLVFVIIFNSYIVFVRSLIFEIFFNSRRSAKSWPFFFAWVPF